MATSMDLKDLENDPRLFLFTSLTAGSSHIITATSRLETILKANKIPFQAIDIATDETARRLWQRRAAKKKLPGLVKDGYVIGDLEEVEEWNEFGELKENIGPVPASNAAPATARQGINIRPSEHATSLQPRPVDVDPPTSSSSPPPAVDSLQRVALPGAAEIAERNKAKSKSTPASEAPGLEKDTQSSIENADPADAAKEISKSHPSLDHLSAPASRIHSEKGSPVLASSADILSGTPIAERRHRGSEVRDAPPDEIKQVESENALHEEDNEDDEAELAKGVQKVKFRDDAKTQEQDAREAEDAGKSVED